MNNFSIFVNTTDSFEDCWLPFFTLFAKYWPDYNGTIYLNTETKYFSYPGLNIVCIKNNINKPKIRISWSECLFKALSVIDDEIILYMQEDYFLKDFVKNNLVENYVQLMLANSEMDCTHLTDQAIINKNKSEKYEGLFKALPGQRYLVSCQAALWRKNTLKKLIRTYENAWQFEEFGSKRARITGVSIFGVDKNWVRLNQFEIIPYIFTGIIQGRWYEPVVDLFEKNSISIDYSKRGFVNDAPKRSLKTKLVYRLRRLPVFIKNSMELIRYKYH
jgi:hypothetical protein